MKDRYWAIYCRDKIYTDSDGNFIIFKSLTSALLFYSFEIPTNQKMLWEYGEIVIDPKESGIKLI